jgi:hypothetical protein
MSRLPKLPEKVSSYQEGAPRSRFPLFQDIPLAQNHRGVEITFPLKEGAPEYLEIYELVGRGKNIHLSGYSGEGERSVTLCAIYGPGEKINSYRNLFESAEKVAGLIAAGK